MPHLLRLCALGLLSSFLLVGCISNVNTKPVSPLTAVQPTVTPDDPYEMFPKPQYRLDPAAPTAVTAKVGLPGSGTITVNWVGGWQGRGSFAGYVVTELPTLSLAPLASPTDTSTTFTAQAPGTYTFTVTAVGHYADVTSAPSPAVHLRAKRDISTLAATLSSDVSAYGATAGVSVIELYPGGQSWDQNGSRLFIAASTYKLGILMFEAQGIAEGRIDPNGKICFSPYEYEPGLGDVVWSGCYTRNFLAYRVAHYSNNTAAHMLVTDLGGGAGLNAYARAHGATNPQLYSPNEVDSNDLAAMWANEYNGGAGGAAAQAWLYPLLTHTDPSHEQGIPAGTPSGATVVHKIGNYGSGNNDAALILNGPSGAYVLVVLTNGLSSASANALMRRLAAHVWDYEAA